MAVIYLDAKPNPLIGIGQGIGQIGEFVSNMMENRNRQKVAQQASQITDPEKQSQFILQSPLNQDDKDNLIKGLTTARMNKLNQTYMQQEMTNATLDQKKKQLDLSEQPELFKQQQREGIARIQLQAAQTTEARARALGVGAEVARDQAEAAKYRAEAGIAQHNAAIGEAMAQQVMNAVNNPHATDADHPPVAAKPGATPVPIDSAKAILDFALGKKTAEETAKSLPLPTMLYQGENQLHMSPFEAQGVVAELRGGRVDEATTKLAQASKFTSFRDIDLGGGIKQKVGYRSDGSTQVVGQPQYVINRMTVQDRQASDGLLAWNATVEGLKELKEKGKLGDQTQRILLSLMPGVFDRSALAGGEGSRAFEYVRSHGVVTASQMLGGRRTQMDTKKLDETLPHYTDPDDKFKASFAASKNLTFTFAKNLLGDFATEGKPLPTELKNFIIDNKLDQKSEAQITSETLGIDAMPTVGGGAAAEGEGAGGPSNTPSNTPNSVGGGAGGAAGGVGGSPSNTARGGYLDATKPIIIAGKSFTAEQIEDFARKHSISTDEVIEGLKNAAGSK